MGLAIWSSIPASMEYFIALEIMLNRIARQLELAGLDAAHLEDLVDDPAQTVCLVFAHIINVEYQRPEEVQYQKYKFHNEEEQGDAEIYSFVLDRSSIAQHEVEPYERSERGEKAVTA